MATAVLTFDLDKEDDREDYKRYNRSLDMACALFDIQNNLRRNVERQVDVAYDSGGDYDEAEMVYSEIGRIFEKYNIEIDEIIS